MGQIGLLDLRRFGIEHPSLFSPSFLRIRGEMANTRSTLPSRLRQLLSGETATGPFVKLDSEPPPEIKAFIDKVIQSPLQDIAILSGFRWEYTKGNFHHWRLLFLHFDTYFKTYLSCRNELLLSDKILEDDNPFPKHAVLQILRVMQTILENCHNKSSFDGLEHFKLLLSSTDPEILIAALETLYALVKINPSKVHGSGKLIGCGSVNNYLLSLAQGWGSKEEGLGLYSCVLSNERTQEEGLSLFPCNTENDHNKSQNQIGSSLYFQLHGLNTQGPEERSGNANSTSSVIHIPDLHLRKEDDLLIMKCCIEQYNVPPELRFSLLTRIRYAHAFRSPRICRLYSRICLLAFIVLVQSNDANDKLATFFVNEPEYTNELIRIVRSEETVPGTIRTLSMLALGAQLAAYSTSHDRARILSGSSISFTVGNRMILLSVLQKAVLSLEGSSDLSSLAFIDTLLQFYLLHIMSSSASGSNIRGSGMVPTFLPLLEDADPNHMHLVYLAVKALQKLMDYSSSAVSLLRELGGVELLAQRLQTEVRRIIGMSGENDNFTGECSKYNDDHLYSQKRLIKVLLKALGSATYAPANSTRPQNLHDSSLSGTLSLIYGNADKFGGDIYYSAVTVMSEIIHKDPTCFPALLDLGLLDSFLSSVLSGVLPSSKAITCVPNGIGALCLNAKGLEAVKETSALRFLVDIFTSKKYVLAMNEAIVPLANATEELLRHVSSLRSSGVDIIIEVVNKVASIGGTSLSGSLSVEKVNCGTAMETESENKGNEEHCCLGGAVDSVTDGVSDEKFLQLCILHLMVLLHRTTENAETCRLFVEKSGIEALLKLLLRPSIVQSSEGMSIALQSTVVFKGFTQHHSAPLARAFCSSLREHLKKALTGFGAASGSFLLDPKLMPNNGICSPLFLVELLLFLAVSKDNRWVTALLAELGNGSKDVLEDIGLVHREILWQIALLEDAKLDMGDDSAGSGSAEPESQQRESSTSDNEEQRFNSFRQFLDPLLRRRIPGWSIESQFFDLVNLYRDLGRATGFQQRLGFDGSNMQFGSNHSTLSDATGSANIKEHDKQRSYHTSCCDMVRSLSFHIIHLFQELGKVMLLPSRRRDDTVNASPALKSVASSFASIALDHMNYGGHVNSSGTEASISTKCRYFGKVIDFINSILLERPDSCNAIILNCLYVRGVVQSVLTTFEATSQLLFDVNRAPASPMDTDICNLKQDEKEDVDHAWIYRPLASYGKLMDHLVTSSCILSPFTKHLLVQPLVSGDVPFPRDAETFVKVLQSMVLKAVLLVWTHPQFTDCSSDFITTVISIIRHIYSGVEVKNVTRNTSARITRPPPNETTITTIVEMGFSRSRAEEALRQVGSNSVELAMEWLFSHPEEIQEDDELARALAMSLGSSETETNVDATNDKSKELEEEMVQLPPVEELLSTCTKLLQMKEPLAFPVRDLLVLICSQNDGLYRSSVISFILDQVRNCSSASDSRNGSLLSALLHVLALILHEDVGAREIASKNGLVKLVTNLLLEWDSGSVDKEKHQVPKWVTTAFLSLDQLLQVDKKLNTEIVEQLKVVNVSSQQTSVNIDEDKRNNAPDMIRSIRNSDSTPSQLDTIFRSLRNGRHSHPLNLWVDESQQSSGSSAATVPQGLEELLVSQLRQPASEKSTDNNTSVVEPQLHGEGIQLQGSGAGLRLENPVENNVNNENAKVPPSSAAIDGSLSADGRHAVNDTLQGTDASSRHSQSVEMQFEQNDATVRDVEAVSQESSGSGATLGESLRSLDVEIGSADGHDDGGERQGSSDRADPQAARARRTSVICGNSTAAAVRDVPLHSVTEVSENFSREADLDGPAAEQQINSGAGSGSIDPAFLDALPEELRAEVLSAQQGQVAQPSNVEQQNSGDIDPEFLAALPPDIRAEVLAQQQAQRIHQSQEIEGQSVEMDTVSIIATFPSDLREEVLLTSSDAIISNLTPALVAGESSRRGEGVGSSLDRIGGSIVSRRSVSAKVIEAEGTPLVGTEALQAMVRLLRIVQPLYKGALQKLLLNLCAHNETRTALVKILLEMLMLDTRKPVNYLNSIEPPYRLYGCQNNVMYSRPQCFDGVPPLVSRRVLETLTYLARNHPYVAKILLKFRLPLATLQEPRNVDLSRGKALMTEQQQEGYISIALLLSLLNQPLYLRSIAHLEQLLNLLDVILDHAERKPLSSEKLRSSSTEQIPASQISTSDIDINAANHDAPSKVVESSIRTTDSSKPSTSCASNECDVPDVLTNLPRAELRLLCSLLARESLSDNAYGLVAEVMKKLVAIAPSHCHLFISELADAIQHLIKSSVDELHMFGEAVKSLLSTASSDGAAILRVLQALSSFVTSISEKEKEMLLLPETECSSALSQVWDINAALEPLWIELSSCISKIESYSDSVPDLLPQSRTSMSRHSGAIPPLPAGAQNILPYIESFFVMCEKLHPAQPGSGNDLGMAAISEIEDASTSAGQLKTAGPISKFDEKQVAFVKFSEKHRKLLNAFIRQNPGLLEKSFSLLLKVPRFVDFDNKRAHFRSKIKHQHDHHHSPLRISVRRAYILEDSYNQLRMRSTQDLKGRLTVHFQGEEGIDAGGLTREWYQLLSRVIFDKGALLFTTVGNESTFQPNPNSVYQTEHLSYFKFVGRVVGKALFDGQLLDVHFTRSFYKHILGVKVTYHDIEAIDPDYFKNLKWMLENDISDVLDLTFSIDADEEKLILYEKTQVTDYELIPGGRNIKVTEENKHQYVDLVAEHRLTTAIRPQINAFLEGFNELIHMELINIFNDKELELLISGLPDIDLDDMRANTEYSGYSAASPVIQWFWDVVQGFSKEDKARLLQFVTGTSKVPLEGFSALQGISGSQKFQIHKAYGSPDHLPSAHTCFNQLDLPEYPSKEHLEERLLLAIHEANEGFGFG
ncbi:hypothetical protein V6N11_025739 [Hibiscus sabdariffa]|uniref:HECT-type E3 ubiquitin transferase n=1 Tax=Hibiscus sabdariffa TaxID=183260 RepID=A0ABR2SUE5_9ROSI